MGIFGLFVFVALLLYIHQSSEFSEFFRDQQCGYCDMAIHWNKKKALWFHENGERRAAGRPDIGYIQHGACPHPSRFVY